MKSRKANKFLQGIALSVCLFPWTLTYAAQQEVFWGKVTDYQPLLKNYTLVQSGDTAKNIHLPRDFSIQKTSINTFHFVNGNVDSHKTSHVRYDQYYKDLPVWNSQVIYHVSATSTDISGSIVNNIEKDIPDLNGKISLDQAKKIASAKYPAVKNMHVEKIIYFDQDVSEKALLAYHVSYLITKINGPEIASYIIDANTGKILQEWNALPSLEVGQGFGGVSVDRLSYRPGKFQYGSSQSGVPSLGMLEVDTTRPGVCTISNNLFRVINLKNRTERQLPFELPASGSEERIYQIKPFAYSCSASGYVNLNDGGYAPVNDGLSPVNDVTYFVKQTFNMLNNEYQLSSPIGNQLPIRVYIHIGNYDNAFACGPTCMRESGISGPQQLIFGNGKANDSSPMTDGDGVSHEFGHLVTENFSNLNYANQSGGMNEAFSDMTGMAMLNYVRETLGYTWFWDGKDWTTGASIMKTGKPMRYFYNPPLDGHSIDNAANYRRNMDVHDSSGVFNKAFYLLSTTSGWTIEKAYRIMLDANMNYWTKNATFQTAACGVVQAAKDRAYSDQDVKNIFQQVGINRWDTCTAM